MLVSPHSGLRPISSTRRVCALEWLEPRFLLAAAPRVTDVSADNRGYVVITLDQPLDAATVSTKSAAIYTTTSGNDKKAKATVSYYAAKKQITLSAPLKADTSYKVCLNSRLIKGSDGKRLDGEYKGPGKKSGDGIPGGDLKVLATPKSASNLVARFYTVLGNIDVRLFSTQAPLTVKNFLRYVNATGSDAEYSYDNSFIHLSEKNHLIQGGGYRVSDDNEMTIIYQRPAVPNEPRPNDPGNIRGTLAAAKLGANANSATNQWFFNTVDNRANLDYQTGGYAVFGQITNAAGLSVMDKIAALDTFNIDPGNSSTPFSKTPLLKNGAPAIKRGHVDPQKDLVIVKRIATLMTVAPTK